MSTFEFWLELAWLGKVVILRKCSYLQKVSTTYIIVSALRRTDQSESGELVNLIEQINLSGYCLSKLANYRKSCFNVIFFGTKGMVVIRSKPQKNEKFELTLYGYIVYRTGLCIGFQMHTFAV